MMWQKLTLIIAFIVYGFTLTACGSGGSVAGIGGTGITAQGKITGFGSIFVNGIEFETNNATVTLDSETSNEAALQLGMVVTVEGTVNSDGTAGVANFVDFDDDVQGPISNIVVSADGNTKTLTVLDVTVLVDSTSTVFDDVTFASLALNDVIEVSGFFDGSNVLQATRIEKKENFMAGISEIEVKGTVTALAGTTFTLGSFSVDFSTADLSDLPNSMVIESQFVEVKGTLSGTTITATEVELEDDEFDDGIKISIEGVVTDYVSDANFMVNGQSVDASNATFSPTTLTLVNGITVEVEGPIVNGVMEAETVEAREGDIEIHAEVFAVSGNTITLQLFSGNIDVVVNSQTQLDDDTNVDDPFTVSDINVGDFLEVKAIDGGTDLIADEIKRDDSDDDILQAPADSCIVGTGVTLLGLTYALVNGTTDYQDQNEGVIANASAFCSQVNGSVFAVKVKDDESNRDGIADEAELEL